MYVVTVVFSLNAQCSADFLPLMQANAGESVAAEPGCQIFDVCVDPTDDTRVFLYEVYDDEAAFQAHLNSPHFQAFDQAVAGLVRHKEVVVYQRLNNG